MRRPQTPRELIGAHLYWVASRSAARPNRPQRRTHTVSQGPLLESTWAATSSGPVYEAVILTGSIKVIGWIPVAPCFKLLGPRGRNPVVLPTSLRPIQGTEDHAKILGTARLPVQLSKVRDLPFFVFHTWL